MKEPSIIILVVGYLEENLLRDIQLQLGTVFDPLYVTISGNISAPKKAYNLQRRQYRTLEFMKALRKHTVDKNSKHLGITNLDLYTEGAEFDFGLALQDKNLCIVSTHRLRPEYYWQPSNPQLLLKRAVKEAVHELGHCFGLEHCYNPRCAMHFSSGVIDTDRKRERFCEECQKRIRTKITIQHQKT